jgi:8-oxo-dGTP diphosphatase
MNKNNIHILSRGVFIDEGHILLCRTLDLKNNFFFLPGGHIEHQESAETALIRELKEETGNEFYIKRFLGCLEHSFEPGHNSICHNHEYNLVFEVGSNNLSSKDKIPQVEKNIELIWIPFSQLPELEFRPGQFFVEIISKWLNNASSNYLYSVMK